MKLIRNSILLLALACAASTAAQSATAQQSTKKERNFIRSGNKLYNEKRYAEAEVEYNKALQENPNSAVAQFNLATTLLRQGNASNNKDDENNPANRAEAMLENLVKSSADKNLLSKAYYDLGNIAYNRQDYGKAIDHYKNALRRNPADDQARDNLRLAQLKKQEQDQNKDKNKDQNKDQTKNQNKDQNKDKNKDKQDQNKDQNKDQQDQNKDKQQQQPKQGGMSQQGMEQILKTMQDKENATQQRVQAVQAKQKQRERARTNNKW